MKQLVLSLFPGIGLRDMAFEEAGYCVVRGPDLLWGGDVHRFDPPAGRFEGIIGGPPCQYASTLRHVRDARGDAQPPINLIPEFERIIGAAGVNWFLMENVRDAHLPVVSGYQVQHQLIRDHWCGGETMRLRRFSFGTRGARRRWQIDTLALHRPDPQPAALASGGVKPGGDPSRRSRLSHMGWKTQAAFDSHLRLQGLPEGFLAKAPFTIEGKIRAVGNGVPLAMGRAVAQAVKTATERMA